MPTILLRDDWSSGSLERLEAITGKDENAFILCELRAQERVLFITSSVAEIQMGISIDLQASDARTDLQFVVKATEFKNILLKIRKHWPEWPAKLTISGDDVLFEVEKNSAQYVLPLADAGADLTPVTTPEYILKTAGIKPARFALAKPHETCCTLSTQLLNLALQKILQVIEVNTTSKEREQLRFQIEIEQQQLSILGNGVRQWGFMRLLIMQPISNRVKWPVVFCLTGPQVRELSLTLAASPSQHVMLHFRDDANLLVVQDGFGWQMNLIPLVQKLSSGLGDSIFSKLQRDTVSPLHIPHLRALLHPLQIAETSIKQRIYLKFEPARSGSDGDTSGSMELYMAQEPVEAIWPLPMTHRFPPGTDLGVNLSVLEQTLTAVEMLSGSKQPQWGLNKGNLLVFAGKHLWFLIPVQAAPIKTQH